MSTFDDNFDDEIEELAEDDFEEGHVKCVDCGNSWVPAFLIDPCPECGSTRFENGDDGEIDEDEAYERDNDI